MEAAIAQRQEDRVVNRTVKRYTGITWRWWMKARVAPEKSWRGCYDVLDRESSPYSSQPAGWLGRTVGCTPEAISSRALLL